MMRQPTAPVVFHWSFTAFPHCLVLAVLAGYTSPCLLVISLATRECAREFASRQS
jgi:hypothetical protein